MLETVSRKILEHITEQCLICCDVGIPCSAKQACIDPSSLIFPFQVGLYGTAFAKKLLDFQLLVIILFFAQQMKSSADRLIKKKKVHFFRSCILLPDSSLWASDKNASLNRKMKLRGVHSVN